MNNSRGVDCIVVETVLLCTGAGWWSARVFSLSVREQAALPDHQQISDMLLLAAACVHVLLFLRMVTVITWYRAALYLVSVIRFVQSKHCVHSSSVPRGHTET